MTDHTIFFFFSMLHLVMQQISFFKLGLNSCDENTQIKQ